MLSKILEFSIRHRVFVCLATFALAALGASRFRDLAIDAVPDITNNQVQITTMMAAMSPVEVEKRVTFPIENALAGIPGLLSTRSLSRNGFSQVTAVFADDVNIYFARQQVGERLREAADRLPAGAEPTLGPISTGLGEVYMWTVEYDESAKPVADGQPGPQKDGSYVTPEGERLRDEVETASYLRTVEDWIVRPQLKGVPGVAGVDAIGGYQKTYVVEVDPLKLVSFGLTFSALAEALERNNVSTGAGYVEHRGESYLVRANGRIKSAREIGLVVVGLRDGVPVHVDDVATVVIGKELRTGSASENGKPVVVGTALMLIGANSRVVAQAVDRKIEAVRKSLPPGPAKTVLDRTSLVDRTIATVRTNLFEGALLVALVLFLMLGSIRGALLTALAIPLSLALAMFGMVQSKISGNLMSLGAIDFGLVVDGATIIVENCLRRLAEASHLRGRTLSLSERLEVVFEAAKEVRGATAFGEAIIIIVYVPILALSGTEGKMFQPMALTVIFLLLAAFVLSLTFVPAMVALVFRGKVAERESFLVRIAKSLYAPTLDRALANPGIVLAAAAAALVFSFGLYRTLGEEFIPTLDEKDVAVHALRVPSTSLTTSDRMQHDVEKTIAAFPEVQFVYSKTGTAEVASDPMPPNVSDTFIILRDRSEWPDPKEPKPALVARIERELEKLPGNAYEFTQPIQMRFNELIAGVRSDVAVKIFGDDFESLVPAAQEIARLLGRVAGAADVRTEEVEGLPALDFDVDRENASRLGLSVADVHEVIAAAIGGRPAGEVFEGDRRFPIVLRVGEALREDIDALGRLPVPIPGGGERSAPAASEEGSLLGHAEETAFVPLAAVASIVPSEGLAQVGRENGKRRIVVQANVRGRDLGSFVAEARTRLDRDLRLPAGTWIEWGGQFENLIAARERLAIVVPLCLAAIFCLLFATFRSWKDTLIVFTGVPLALTGGVLALHARGMSFSITAAVGFIALSGVAVLNGLVLVTFFRNLRASGATVFDAVRLGSLTRLRPVMMTALVASLGFIPMALSHGAGAEVQRPLATVVIGGILSSTLLTLIVLPVLYLVTTRERRSAESA